MKKFFAFLIIILVISGCGMKKPNNNENTNNSDNNFEACKNSPIDLTITKLNWQAIDITCIEKGKTLQVVFHGYVSGSGGSLAMKLANKNEALSNVKQRFDSYNDSQLTSYNPENNKEQSWHFSSIEILNGMPSPTLVIFNSSSIYSVNVDGRLTFKWVGIGN